MVLASILRAGQEIGANYDRVDVLINNAGIHAFSQRVTAEGFAEMTAVNYLAPWVLTNTLLSKLTASASGRIVNVASQASRQAGSITPAHDLTDTGPYGRRESGKLYGRSKLMSIMFTQEFARRLAPAGVTVNCCCPGFNTTGLGRELPFAGALEKILKGLHIGDPRHGAKIITRLAADPAFASTTGGYFSANAAKPLECPEPGRDQTIQRELWETTARLLDGTVTTSG